MDKLKAWTIWAITHVSAALPLSWARGLGRLLARIYWPFNGSSRRVTERNLALAFPDMPASERRQLARESLAATAELIAEMGHVWLHPWSRLQRRIVRVEGAELVQAARDSGRGVIVLAPHLGNWEVAGLHVATLGPTVALYEPPQISALGPMIERARQRTGSTLVPTDSRGLARLLKSVRGGHISGILPDQCPRDLNAGMNSEFMGVPCFTGTLASNMIRRTGAVALFCRARRVPGGFDLRYTAAEEAIYDADTATSLAAMNRGVEHLLQDCVAQYQWEYKRFKVRPRNGNDVYADC